MVVRKGAEVQDAPAREQGGGYTIAECVPQDAPVSGTPGPATACTRGASVKRPGKEGHCREKVSISPHFFIPMPVVLIGTQVNGRANFMTVGWCSRANANPKIILSGRGNHHYTPKGIEKTKTFPVNIPHHTCGKRPAAAARCPVNTWIHPKSSISFMDRSKQPR